MTELTDEVLAAIRARRGYEFTPRQLRADVLQKRQDALRERHPRLPARLVRFWIDFTAPTPGDIHGAVRLLKLTHPHLHSLHRRPRSNAYLRVVRAY